METVFMDVHILALLWMILYYHTSSQKISLIKHISRQLGQRFGMDTETCSQPMQSLAIARSLKGSKGIKNAPSFPAASVEPNTPSRIRYSFGTLNIILQFKFVSF